MPTIPARRRAALALLCVAAMLVPLAGPGALAHYDPPSAPALHEAFIVDDIELIIPGGFSSFTREGREELVLTFSPTFAGAHVVAPNPSHLSVVVLWPGGEGIVTAGRVWKSTDSWSVQPNYDRLPESERTLWTHPECRPNDVLTLTVLAVEEDWDTQGQTVIEVIATLVATGAGYGAGEGPVGMIVGGIVGLLIAIPVNIWGGHDPYGFVTVALPPNQQVRARTDGADEAAVVKVRLNETVEPENDLHCGQISDSQVGMMPAELQVAYAYSALQQTLGHALLVAPEPGNPANLTQAQVDGARAMLASYATGVGEVMAAESIARASGLQGAEAAALALLEGRELRALDASLALARYERAALLAGLALEAGAPSAGTPDVLPPTVLPETPVALPGGDVRALVFVHGGNATLEWASRGEATIEPASVATTGTLFDVEWSATDSGDVELGWASDAGSGVQNVAFEILVPFDGPPVEALSRGGALAVDIENRLVADYNAARAAGDVPRSIAALVGRGILLDVDMGDGARSLIAIEPGPGGTIAKVREAHPHDVLGAGWIEEPPARTLQKMRTALGLRASGTTDVATIRSLLAADDPLGALQHAISTRALTIDGGGFAGGFGGFLLTAAAKFRSPAFTPPDAGTLPVVYAGQDALLLRSRLGYPIVHASSGPLGGAWDASRAYVVPPGDVQHVVSLQGDYVGFTTKNIQHLASVDGFRTPLSANAGIVGGDPARTFQARGGGSS